MQYKPIYKPNQLILGEGRPVIITGWTVRQSIAKKLDKGHYAAIGQLYSPTRGISPLIRNLLANPFVYDLVGISATREDKNSGGVRCLGDFFAHGVRKGQSDTGKDCWVINSDVPGYIDAEIPLIALTDLRNAINFHQFVDVETAIAAIKSLPPVKFSGWGESQIFPVADATPSIFPGNRYGHRIEGATIAETWVKLLHRIKTTGTIRPTGYDGQWQELIDLIAVVTDEPENYYFPEPNYLPLDRAFLENYIPQILEDAPYREGVKYTYGQRLRSWFDRDQVEQVINKLIGEIDAASAVMNLWDVKDHEKGGSPCLNHIWVRVVDGELSLTATFRSNDMFGAWPSNAMGLRALQKHICSQINERSDFALTIGPLITISQSAHIYDDCWENVDKLIAEQYQQFTRPKFHDPAGSFLITLDCGEINVQHLTPGNGGLVQTFTGKKAITLTRKIAAAIPHLETGHALYLGLELQKAEIALAKGIEYNQDSPLDFRQQ